MEKASQVFLLISILFMLIGFFDRLTTATFLIEGVAPGSYWKAGIAFIAYSIAASQLAILRRST